MARSSQSDNSPRRYDKCSIRVTSVRNDDRNEIRLDSGLFFISVSKSFVEIFIRWLSFDRSVEELGSDIVGYIYSG